MVNDKIYRMKIDIDEKNKKLLFNLSKRLIILKKYLGLQILNIDEKESNSGYHIRLDVISKIPLDDKDIVFLQLWLGSDWRRELFNFLRVKHGFKRWNVLFKKKVRFIKGKMKVVSEEK